MSHPEYLKPRLEITELICILNVVRSAVFVVTFTVYSIRFPPTVSRNLIGSYFCGCMANTMHDYVTMLTTGIYFCVTKPIVFVFFHFS